MNLDHEIGGRGAFRDKRIAFPAELIDGDLEPLHVVFFSETGVLGVFTIALAVV